MPPRARATSAIVADLQRMDVTVQLIGDCTYDPTVTATVVRLLTELLAAYARRPRGVVTALREPRRHRSRKGET